MTSPSNLNFKYHSTLLDTLKGGGGGDEMIQKIRLNYQPPVKLSVKLDF